MSILFFTSNQENRPYRLKLFAPLLVFLLGFSLPQEAKTNQPNPQLNELLKQLKQAPTFEAGQAIENIIWKLWGYSGRPDVDKLMKQGVALLSTGNYILAVEIFSEVIRLTPYFAEGWNKRATAYYLLNKFEASIQDITETLRLEPRHFGALSGMGLVCIAIGDRETALKAFQAALIIHPHLAGARLHIEKLLQSLKGLPS